MKRCTVAGSRTVTTSKTSFLTSKLPFPCVFLWHYFIVYVNLFLDVLLRSFCVKDSVIRLWWLLTGAGISLTTKFSRILCLVNFFVFHKINSHPQPHSWGFNVKIFLRHVYVLQSVYWYVIIIIISFMHGIYTYIPETNYVPKEYSVAAILLLLFMVLISLVSVLNL